MTEKMDKTIEAIRSNWIIIVFIGSLIFTWSQFQQRVATLEARVAIAETKIDSTTIGVQAINVSLAQIQTTLDFIKNQLK